MNKKYIASLLGIVGIPALMILLGLILLISPDSASALAAKLLGWVLTLYGLGYGLFGFFATPAKRAVRVLWALVFLALGIFLLRNPLFLAESLGRIVGLFLVLRGIGSLSEAMKLKRDGLPYLRRMTASLITLVCGAVLIVLPLTASRLLFGVCGGVMVAVGVINLLSRLDEVKRLQEPKNDKKIIDAEQ